MLDYVICHEGIPLLRVPLYKMKELLNRERINEMEKIFFFLKKKGKKRQNEHFYKRKSSSTYFSTSHPDKGSFQLTDPVKLPLCSSRLGDINSQKKNEKKNHQEAEESVRVNEFLIGSICLPTIRLPQRDT